MMRIQKFSLCVCMIWSAIIFLMVWIAYTIFHRVTSTQQRSGNNRTGGSNSSGRQPGTSNIRGMKDLPKPPPKGG